MACTDAMVAFALQLKPEFTCLVPENRTEVTTEGGLDLATHRSRVRDTVAALTAAGIKTSLFIDPDEAALEAAAEMRSPFVELHTGAFANAFFTPAAARELERLRLAATLGQRLGLGVNAGHGINYVNVAAVRTIPHLHEFNIGHSILSRALLTGIDEAVREMQRRMQG
jgi:pyridoxine 5-phosphate synthase